MNQPPHPRAILLAMQEEGQLVDVPRRPRPSAPEPRERKRSTKYQQRFLRPIEIQHGPVNFRVVPGPGGETVYRATRRGWRRVTDVGLALAVTGKARTMFGSEKAMGPENADPPPSSSGHG